MLLLPRVAFPQVTFQKLLTGITFHSYSIRQTPGNGFIISGFRSFTGSSNRNIFLVKTDSTGNIEWTKTYGGPDNAEDGTAQPTTDGGYIVGGSINGDLLLMKTDSAGNISWAKTYGGPAGESAGTMQQTSDGGYIITAYTLSAGAGGLDIYLVKTDSLGNLEWQKTYGGSANDVGVTVHQTSKGGYFITGVTESFGITLIDYFAILTDAQGDTVWTRTFGGSSGEFANYSCETADGGFIINGWTTSFGVAAYNHYLVKTDSIGNLEWSKTVGVAGDDEGINIFQMPDQSYILGGTASDTSAPYPDAALIHIDSSGNVLWAKAYGTFATNDGVSFAQPTTDNGFVFTGYTNFPNNMNSSYFVKTDSAGNSGCYDHDIFPQVFICSTVVGYHPFVVTSPAFPAQVAVIAVDTGGTMVSLCPTGSAEIENENHFSIAPNPGNGNFSLKFPTGFSHPILSSLYADPPRGTIGRGRPPSAELFVLFSPDRNEIASGFRFAQLDEKRTKRIKAVK